MDEPNANSTDQRVRLPELPSWFLILTFVAMAVLFAVNGDWIVLVIPAVGILAVLNYMRQRRREAASRST